MHPNGDPSEAHDSPPDSSGRELDFARVYQEMRVLARRLLGAERANHTLQATALVNEAWLRLSRGGNGEPADPSRFRRNAALAMRQILVDHSRRHATEKRGGGAVRIPIDALALASQGLNGDLLAIEEVAEVLGRSVRSVNRDWSYAKAVLARELAG